MGNACCSDGTVDRGGDMNHLAGHKISTNYTMAQLALIVKVQSQFRGFLARKKIRAMQVNAGMDRFHYEEGQQDYDNEKVQQIRNELGEFDYDEETNHGEETVEYRAMIELENHAKYDGEWIKGQDIRQGKGRQIWPDGSMYEGWWK